MTSSRRAARALALTALLALGAAAPASAQDGRAAGRALDEARAALAGKGAGNGRELTLILRDLAAGRSALGPRDRRAVDEILRRPTDDPNPTEGEFSYQVDEETPLCNERFCIHYVADTEDAPDMTDADDDGTPDYVERVLEVFDEVYARENTQLGWPVPPSDGTLGGGPELDVYLGDIGLDGTYGYVAPDAGQPDDAPVKHSYQVMDDDYEEFDGDVSLQVTAAHEYNHVLQFGINAPADAWWFEATATWMEEQVYPLVDDYLQYVGPWAAATGGGTALTSFIQHGLEPQNYQYGSAVWNHYVTARQDEVAVRDTWTRSVPGEDALTSYDRVLTGGFAPAFAGFAAAVAEWKAPGSPFPDSALYPDAARTGALAVDGAGVTSTLDHASFDLRDVTGASAATIRLEATFPPGVSGAVALVGAAAEGTPVQEIALAPDGGPVSVDLANPGANARVTAVIVNADRRHGPVRDEETEEWDWTHDDVPVPSRVITAPATDPGPEPTPTPPNPAPAPGPSPAPTPAPPVVVVPPDTTGPLVRVPTSNRARRATAGGVVSFTVGPMAENTSGVLSMKSDKRIRVGGRRQILTLGSRAFQVLSGQTGTVQIRLSKRARRALRKTKRLRVQATITARDAAGNATVRTYRFTLRAPRR